MSVLVQEGVDAGALWHSGDPMREQRTLESGTGVVTLGSDVFTISGPDRLSWLHSLTTQHLSNLPVGESTTAFVLSPQGHIEHAMDLVDDGEQLWLHTEPGRGQALADWLTSMQFMMRVEITLRPDLGLAWSPRTIEEVRELVGERASMVRSGPWGGSEIFFADEHGPSILADLGPQVGLWAYTALRVAAGYPRFGADTDHRTIPNEIGLVGTHLDKGCYRGQETVARVHTLGRPPRRLVRLLLDGSMDLLPESGQPISHNGREIGFVGSVARHHDLGPIALALVKRNVPVDATLVTGPDGAVTASQEVLVDPDVGMHVRARL